MSRKRISVGRILRVLKSILRVVLCILMFISMTAGCVWLLADQAADECHAVSVKVADEEYCDILYRAVQTSLERKMA